MGTGERGDCSVPRTVRSSIIPPQTAAVTMWVRLLVVMTGCLAVTPQGHENAGTVREYCEREFFNATCARDEVVVMRTARYGRMRLGRCVTENYSAGCSRDVLPYLDRKCSGRTKCYENVGTVVPLEVQPCPGDFRSYLEASYSCVKVASPTGDRNLCQASTHVAIRGQMGYLANQVTETSRLGSLDCPWLIEMRPGQTIRLTLLDFSGALGRVENICHVYATIKEAAASTSETVCASHLRETIVYTSTTNVVEVRLVTKRQEEQGFYFLIKYEAVGCGDPVKPKYGWVERRGDLATIGCTYTDEKWNLQCKGSTWSGSYGNCTNGGESFTKTSKGMWNNITFPSGLSIVLIMCIALFIGIVILAVGLVCLRRRHMQPRPDSHMKVEQVPEVYNSYRRPSPRQQQLQQLQQQQQQALSHHHQPPQQQQHTMPRVGHLPKPPNTSDGGFQPPENDYSRTWQMQRHPAGRSSLPPPPGQAHNQPIIDPRNPFGRNYDQHVYESPKFERREIPEMHSSSEAGSEPGVNAQYYELDPEAVPLDCGPAPVHSMRDVTGSSLDDQKTPARNPLLPNYNNSY